MLSDSPTSNCEVQKPALGYHLPVTVSNMTRNIASLLYLTFISAQMSRIVFAFLVTLGTYMDMATYLKTKFILDTCFFCIVPIHVLLRTSIRLSQYKFSSSDAVVFIVHCMLICALGLQRPATEWSLRNPPFFLYFVGSQ